MGWNWHLHPHSRALRPIHALGAGDIWGLQVGPRSAPDVPCSKPQEHPKGPAQGQGTEPHIEWCPVLRCGIRYCVQSRGHLRGLWGSGIQEAAKVLVLPCGTKAQKSGM